jgi:hypothetical protein
MTKRTVSVDELYASRHRPYGQNRDVGARRSIEHEPSMTARDQQRNQMPEDAHASNYRNDCSGWVRGAPPGATPTDNNETAMGKPVDRGQSYRRANKGDTWNSQTAADRVSFVKPEPVTANRQQRRTGG